MIIDIEDFIAVKGFKAMGNQLTTDKLKQVNLLEPLAYVAPLEVREAASKRETNSNDIDVHLDEDGQIILF
jgi:topoisomerase-4 subunit A